MAQLHCEFYSEAMRMATAVEVYLPDKGELGRKKTVYLLHGLSDNCSAWSRYTALERYADQAGVAVVMPEVQRSFYCDTASGMDYFRYISGELPQMCAHFFGLSQEREQTYIMGLSMGGFGALKCALTYPQRYAGCGSFSGALRMESSVLCNVLKREELTAITGQTDGAGPENDLWRLARMAENCPPIYLSCGEQDRLYPVNQAFAEHLRDVGVDFRFDHRPGTHSWEFWDQSVRDCFHFFFGDDAT